MMLKLKVILKYLLVLTVSYIFVTVSKCEEGLQVQDTETPVVFPHVEEIPERRCLVSADGSEGSCRPTGLCVFRFDSISQLELSSCKLNNQEMGICCPKKPPATRSTGPIRPLAEHPVQMPDISLNELDSAGEEGLSFVQQIDQLELELKRKGLFVQKNTKEYFHQAIFGGSSRNLTKFGRDGLVGVEATLKLVRTFQLDTVQSRDGLRHFSLSNTIIKDTCPTVPPCPPTKYRTMDGSCNNLQHPSFGKAMTAFRRLLPPRYSDGINTPRGSYDGGPLPSAREVSTRGIPSENRPSRKLTSLFTQWGEFLAHDLTMTALTTAGNGEGLICCDERIQQNPKLLHPACLPIFVPSNDPFYTTFETNCMEFVRSLAAPRPDCNFGPREQLNQVTAFIDGSLIYGSSDNESNSIRSFSGGKLKSEIIEKQELLPKDQTGKFACIASNTSKCFVAGDYRVNEHLLLTTMHTLFLREHNRLAGRLARFNPGWNDEILFLETRRIIAAVIQHITYTEFLPLLLGRKIMSSFKLTPMLAGYDFDYSAHANPGIINSFAASAFRMGHTLVQSRVDLIQKDGFESVPLKTLFYEQSLLQKKNSTMEALIRGMVNQPAQTYDSFVSSDLTQHLFQSAKMNHGLDLVALNIQRGRDHGLVGYNEWREHCGLPRINSFENLATVMDPVSARNFSRLYRNVDDIDLYPAGIAEHPLPDAIVGSTFSCIIAEQFRRLKQGDRFWYENGGMESSFTEGQLLEIRKTTVARMLCDNTDIDQIQLVTFLKPAEWNPLESCKSNKIPSLDLSSWRNEPVWS